MSLDRFSQGLKDSQEADFWECPKCGGEVYDLSADDCSHCKEAELAKQAGAFRKELRDLEERHGVRGKGYGTVYLEIDDYEEEL